ncbi:MAG TPA: DUF6209 family protein [Polyangia bacterium]|nr:DUF6209 family protein [Polyangia bacterium]
MQRLVARLAIAWFAVAAGCGGQAQDPSAEVAAADTTSTSSTPPTLSFAADWSVTQSAPVVSGGKATIHYDIARLPNCRMQYEGGPAWGIVAYWAVDGGQAFSQPVTQLQNGDNVPVDVTFDVPPGADLAVWFYASDEGGCSQWDSSYGRNFHFALVADAPAIHFRWPAWSDDQSAPLVAGHDFLVDYDIRRLPFCRQDYNGLQTWDVTVGYRFDGGAAASASLTTTPNDYQRVQAPARIAAPAGAATVELWFVNDDRTGCQTWDSAYGTNYRFALVR